MQFSIRLKRVLLFAAVVLELETLESNDWLKLNPSETGYYRVNYDDAMWSTLNNQLMTNHTVFAELDRSNLIDDAFNLAPWVDVTIRMIKTIQ